MRLQGGFFGLDFQRKEQQDLSSEVTPYERAKERRGSRGTPKRNGKEGI